MIIEKSSEFKNIIKNSAFKNFYESRLKMAEFRLRVEITKELAAIGSPVTEEYIDKVYNGIPKETLRELLTNYT